MLHSISYILFSYYCHTILTLTLFSYYFHTFSYYSHTPFSHYSHTILTLLSPIIAALLLTQGLDVQAILRQGPYHPQTRRHRSSGEDEQQGLHRSVQPEGPRYVHSMWCLMRPEGPRSMMSGATGGSMWCNVHCVWCLIHWTLGGHTSVQPEGPRNIHYTWCLILSRSQLEAKFIGFSIIFCFTPM